eukprot:8139601-Pyramimonas_sp.AAC.1
MHLAWVLARRHLARECRGVARDRRSEPLRGIRLPTFRLPPRYFSPSRPDRRHMKGGFGLEQD